MQVNLDDDQVSALTAALSGYIPQLREEIGKTENYDMRESLKKQEQALTTLLTTLGGSLTDTTDLGSENPPWG